MKEIPLSRGKVAKVDDEDYDALSRYKWNAHSCNGVIFYALRYAKKSEHPSGVIRMHREILGCPGSVDHIDHDGLNNQRHNLREASTLQNGANKRANKSRADGYSSQYKGVHRCGNKWRASIRVKGEAIYLGSHAQEVTAAAVYDLAAVKYFGEFACPNFPAKPR